MTRKEAFSLSSGLSLDGQIPLTIRTQPSESSVIKGGFALLYDQATKETPDRISVVERPGRIYYFDDPKEPDDPFIFVKGGYKVEYNNYTGDYNFSINPDFDVDFDFIERQSEEDKRKLLLQLLYMTPTITATHDSKADENPQLAVKINRSNLKLFTSSPGTNCTWKAEDMTGNFREVNDRVQIIGLNKNITYVSGPTERIPFSFYTTADVAKAESSLHVTLENLAQNAEKDPPSNREIAQIGTAKVCMVEKDPFEGVSF